MSSKPLDALAEAEALSAEVQRLYNEGAFRTAIALAKRALDMRELVLGPEHPRVAVSLNILAFLYQAQGAYAKAEPLYERALRICEHVLGAEHPHVAAVLNNLATACQDQGAYAKAEPHFKRALRIREQVLGPEHPDVATSLNKLALLYQAQGAYAAAEPLFARALHIREQVLGPEHPDVAASLNDLAGLYRVQGAYAQAERLYQRALGVYERLLVQEHQAVATVLNNLALLYKGMGTYAQAELLYGRALGIREHLLGAEHPDVASSLNDLALLYQAQGVYARAEPLYQRALRIFEHMLGPEHPNVATSLNNLALLYQAQGVYAQAEPLYQRALNIREHVLKPEHPDVANSLNNLAGLYTEQGAYGQAEPLYERALSICEKALGPEHWTVATSLNNLARLYQAQGRYAQAKPFFERALRIRETALGPEHPDVATSLNNLALLYQAQGAYIQAEPLHERALRIQEHVLGPEHPDVATSLNNLAMLYKAQSRYAQAEPLFERALRIREHVLGHEHPDVAISLDNLAELFWRTRDVSRALDYFVRAVALRERHLGLTLAALPESRKRRFLQTQPRDAEALVSFHAHCTPDNADALALTLTAILRRKGRLLEEVTREQAALRRNLSPALQGELDMLQKQRAELAIRRQTSRDLRHADALRTLAHDVERLEGELSRKSAAFRAHAAPTTIKAVQAALPSSATLVEFLHYRRFDPDIRDQEWREARYVAYVLQREGPPQWVALGEAEPIEAAVAAALSALAQPEHDPREPLRALDELVFAPIRRQLGPRDRYLLSPDAVLHLVPFAAMVDEAGRYLVDRLRITYVTTGRDLVRAAAQDVARSRPLVLAAPDYGGRWAPLPGAQAEAEALRSHFADIDLHVGPNATKDKLSAAQSPLFVHVATHGFVRPSRASASPRAASSTDEREIVALPSLPPRPDIRPDIEDALDEAGLIFAGSNEADATLTAREIAGIDLRGTQLVVLSACDTGTGEIARSEGVYGLRRALAIAGAQTQVVSLWKVDDEATSELMDRYYGGLCSGGGRSEALRQAQLALLSDEQHTHPHYWAAFVAIGDERPLSQSR